MAKYPIDNGASSLDPFADFKAANLLAGGKPQPNINPYQGMDDPNIAETFSGAKLEEGFSLLGNSNLALATQKQSLYQEQGIGELLLKGTLRTVGKIGTEVLKMPGYAVGGLAALGNETIGSGKNSMAMAVDNVWIKAMNSLDQGIKDQIPIEISQQIQEGNIWDKAASGSWWATQGADGAGFMLSMFVPGAITKVLGAGKALAGLTEVLANTRLGKGVQVAGNILKADSEVAGLSSLAGQPFRIGETFARNADGVTAALMNTTLESMSEAADTYQTAYKQYTEKVRTGEMSDERARELAGSQASSVFKSNMALLMVSNLADQAFIWKAFGKGPVKSAIADAIESSGKDFSKVVENLGNKGWKELSLHYGKDFVLNAAKEGVFEEGVQTTIQQNAAKGRTGVLNAIGDLAAELGGAFVGDDTFWNNKELHESMFLGAALGGPMGLIGGIKENLDLKRTLNGYDRTKVAITPIERVAQKLGFKRETKDQKGLKSLIQDSWLKNFKTDLNGLKGPDGELDQQKVAEAFELGNKEIALHALYDAAVQSGDTIAASKFGTFLAQHYVQPFLGQAGMDIMFSKHVENQVAPAWAERFKANNGREATSEELSQFKQDFTESGNRVFRAYGEAERTNYPERYYKGEGDNQSYAKFRQHYFQGKFETLLELDSLNLEKTKLNKDLLDAGLTSKVTEMEGRFRPIDGQRLSPIEDRKLDEYNQKFRTIKESEQRLGEVYNQFFTKEGVKSIYDLSKQIDQSLEEVQKDVAKENESLVEEKQSVEQEATINQAEMQAGLEAMQGLEGNPPMIKSQTTGKKQPIESTPEGIALPEEGRLAEPKDFLNNKLVDPNEPDAEDINEQQIHLEDFQDIPFPEEVPSIVKAIKEEPIVEPERLNDNQVEKEFVELGKLNTTDRITTGRHIEYDTLAGKIQDKLTPDGLPVLGSIEQQRWQNTLDKIDNPLAYQVEAISIGQLRDKYSDRYAQIIQSVSGYQLKDNEVWVFLHKDGQPVKQGENYIFTSLYTPSTLYKSMDDAKVAEKYILNTYSQSTGQEIPTSPKAFREFKQSAFDHAYSDYAAWYNNLSENPRMLQVEQVTNGHMLTKKDEHGDVVWNKALGNVPGVTIEKGSLKGGQIEISTTGEVESNGKLLKVNKGDVVITTPNGIYPMRNRNLNSSEVDTIIKLIQKVSPDTSLSNLRQEGEFPVSAFETEKSLGIFYEPNKSSLIRYLMNWGGKGEGSINIGQGNLTVTFQPFGSELTVTLPIADLSNKSSPAYQQLKNFLETKRYNVSKELFNTGNSFAKPMFKGDQFIMDKQGKTYVEYLMNDVLQTMSVVHPDYPSRLQRNLVLGDPVSQVDSPIESTNVNALRQARIDAADNLTIDSIFTVDEILHQKILSNEITKYCK